MTPELSRTLRAHLIAPVRILAVLGLMALSYIAAEQPSTNSRIPQGLWIGEVTLGRVGELRRPMVAAATADSLSFLILLHVAANGDTHLLKDATVAAVKLANQPKTEVVVTDEQLPQLRPVLSELNKPLVKRFGSVAYDWDSTDPIANRYRRWMTVMTDTDDKQRSEYEVQFTIAANAPTNPFRHRFHPDHQTGIQVSRKVTIRLPSVDRSARKANGITTLAGDYEEAIGGLTGGTNKLRVWGTVFLSRVSDVGVLGLPSPP